MQLIQDIKTFLKEVIDIRATIDTQKADESIRGNIYFKGPNVWILVCAIVLASVGLNVNSTAVIIGAMLVSPLMGPIFGIGLGLGTDDADLIKSALKNLATMVIISLLAASLYFLLTPLKLANPTELMSRTNPTIYDVMIALFGGRNEPQGKGNGHFRRRDCYCIDASSLYCRLRRGIRKPVHIPRCIVSVLHKLHLHHPGHILDGQVLALP